MPGRRQAWFKIRYNNELERLTRTERLEALLKILQVITAIMAIYPQIVEAVDWYKLLIEFKDALNIQGDFFLTENKFKEAITKKAELMAQQMQLQAAQVGSEIGRNAATAGKDRATADNIKSGG